MSSNARAFFDEILKSGDPFVFLSDLVNASPPRFETEWLDFKCNPQPQDVLKIWSEAVSGFANTEGGVLLWGIDCRKDQVTGIDAASALSLIDDPTALKSRLQTNINATTDPPVQGIQIETVAGSDGKGCVVCYIPESTNKPHRAEQKTNKPYMIRVGDSFVIPSPSLLRSMFFPRTRPAFQIEGWPEWNPGPADNVHSPTEVNVDFRFRITNVGNASAESLFIQAKADCSGKWATGEYRWTTAETIDAAFGAVCGKLLHPRMVSLFAMFDTSLPAASQAAMPHIIPGDGVRFEFHLFAKDMESTVIFVEFDLNDVVRKVRMTGVVQKPLSG